VSGASVYPLVWNILLAARNEGYGGNLTSMAVPQEAQVRQLLGLPDTHALAALVPLGRPTRQLTKLRRRTVEEFVTHERFDDAPFTPPNTPR
jgi:nitroreductase